MVKKDVRTTGFTADTPKHFIVDAGALYKNLEFDAEEGKYKGEPIGATSGGSTVNVEQEYRTIEIDGVFTDAVGTKMLQSSSASMEVNIKEVTAETIKMGINGIISTGDGETAPKGAEVVTGKGTLENSDYIQNVALVGRYSGSDEPIIVILDNVLSDGGLEFSVEDNNEAIVTMTLKAHADAGQVADRALPMRVIFPKLRS